MGEELLVVKSKQDIEQMRSENPGKEVVSYLIPAAILECDKFDLLIELVSGGVVIDIDSSNIIYPPSLDEMSMNELTILEQGMKLDSFNAKEVQQGINFFKVEAILSDMVKRKLVTIKDNKYQVGDRFRFLYHPEKYSGSFIPEKMEVDGTKMEPKVKIADVRDMIDRVVKVNTVKECWIYYHKVKK
jgi:hypothetical protein